MTVVLDGSADRLGHEDLAELGVPDVANARTLLGWLGILTGGKRPHPDLLAAKADGAAALRAFLRGQTVRGRGDQLVIVNVAIPGSVAVPRRMPLSSKPIPGGRVP